LVFTSIVDNVSLPTSKPTLLLTKPSLLTKAVLPSGVSSTWAGLTPTGMSVGFLIRVFTSMVDTVSLRVLVTKAVLPSGVTVSQFGPAPTGMSARVLRPGLHVDGRHRAADGVSDEGGLAVRGQRHVDRPRTDADVVGVLGPGLHVDGRHRAAE